MREYIEENCEELLTTSLENVGKKLDGMSRNLEGTMKTNVTEIVDHFKMHYTMVMLGSDWQLKNLEVPVSHLVAQGKVRDILVETNKEYEELFGNMETNT